MDNFACNQASPHCVRGSPGCHFYDHYTPSPVGVTISNHELICVSVIVGGNTSKCSLGMTPFGRGIKENHPMQYMPYMEDHFYMAMGLQLNGLRDFTRWIKQGSYYHGLVARQGHLHKCPHLVGAALLRWPQTTPSESHQVSQKKAETPATSFSAPSTGPREAQETHSNDIPARMETGGVGDGQSWVEQVEASADDEFQRDRPTKHRRSQSRRQEDQPTLPFSLQDNKGRCTSAQQLYQHAGEQLRAHHNVATLGITHLYLELLPHEARSLGNQVLCMIAEYHLTSSAQGLMSLSPVLLEVVQDLLSPIKDYVEGGAFQGMRDMRVVDRARTLRIATWLHRLDMSAQGMGWPHRLWRSSSTAGALLWFCF